MARDHERYVDEIGPYLLGALTDLEQQAFERHAMGCASCRDEIERLRPAAEALPRSVAPLNPPPSVKASVMEIVEREATAASGAARSAPRLGRFAGIGFAFPRMPRAAAWAGAAVLLGVGAVGGVGLSRALDDEQSRTVTARIDRNRLPLASASLEVPHDENGGILRVHGMPSLAADRVYELWVERDGEVVPESIFSVGSDGTGAAAAGDDLRGADAVLVTREPHGGARAPSEKPVIRVEL